MVSPCWHFWEVLFPFKSSHSMRGKKAGSCRSTQMMVIAEKNWVGGFPRCSLVLETAHSEGDYVFEICPLASFVTVQLFLLHFLTEWYIEWERQCTSLEFYTTLWGLPRRLTVCFDKDLRTHNSRRLICIGCCSPIPSSWCSVRKKLLPVRELVVFKDS